jgi:predicted metal-dependent phosphoesterase TrpH
VVENENERIVVFGEELRLDPPLPELLVVAQRHLEELRDRWGDVLPAAERFDLLSEALDELEAALDSVRVARDRLGRIESHLALSFDLALARLRSAERELAGPAAE